MKNKKIELKGITKTFPGVLALDNVDISARHGSVHAIMGENGAGKSTLMKILNGLYTPDSGQVFVDGKEVQIKNTLDAYHKGIAMIHQELNYFPDLSIAENIFLGRFPGKGFINWKEVHLMVSDLLQQEGLNYNPKMLIKNLSISDIQMLEIIKALSFNANVIIMDEPTSAITNREVDRLFTKIEDMKNRGMCILYISHKMDEIFRIADEITILRDGKVVSTGSISEYTKEKLITQMVGRKIENIYPKEEVPIGDICLNVNGLYAENQFKDISFNVKRGEIVGIAGLVGAGRTELARAISGFDRIDSGEIFLDNKQINIRNINDVIRKGICMVSEDRRNYGIVGCRNVIENVTLAHNTMSPGLFSGFKSQIEKARRLIKSLDVRTPNLSTDVQFLSGGNQQKVVLCKWLMLDAKVLILDEPTRGIDVGAKYEIYRIICRLAHDGVAVLMISSEIPELIGMADRIYIMNKGRITAELDKDNFSQELIMKYAIGQQEG